MNTYQIYFRGYRREENIGSLPTYSGIYMVYTCRYNVETQKVSLVELIYIGQAENINKDINNHSLKEAFKSELKEGEQLCYSYAEVEEADLNIVKNALVFSQKPKLNTQYTRSFNHPASHFIIEGKCALLNNTNFSIE